MVHVELLLLRVSLEIAASLLKEIKKRWQIQDTRRHGEFRLVCGLRLRKIGGSRRWIGTLFRADTTIRSTHDQFIACKLPIFFRGIATPLRFTPIIGSNLTEL